MFISRVKTFSLLIFEVGEFTKGTFGLNANA